jgi:hypothetical protein
LIELGVLVTRNGIQNISGGATRVRIPPGCKVLVANMVMLSCIIDLVLKKRNEGNGPQKYY